MIRRSEIRPGLGTVITLEHAGYDGQGSAPRRLRSSGLVEGLSILATVPVSGAAKTHCLQAPCGLQALSVKLGGAGRGCRVDGAPCVFGANKSRPTVLPAPQFKSSARGMCSSDPKTMV